MECENHPEEVAVENCVVCGAGVCDECLRSIDGEPYCITCAEEYSQEYGEQEDESEEEGEEYYDSEEADHRF